MVSFLCCSSSTKMNLDAFVVIFLASSILHDCSSQIPVTSFSSKSSEVLRCNISSQNTYASWAEVAGDGSTIATIYEYNKGSGVTPTPPPTEGKYSNFLYQLNEDVNFDLVIENVDKDDGGTYRCVEIPLETIEYLLEVEVVSNLVISSNGTVYEEGESYAFTCSVQGVRSSNELQLVWSTDDTTADSGTSEVVNEDDDSLEDLNSTYILQPKKTDTFLRCNITGYETQQEINDTVISKRLDLDVRYIPVCTLIFGEDVVGKSGCTVTLICNCSANPDVTAGGYSYFKDNAPIDGNTDRAEGKVEQGNTTEFSCRGTNILGSGEKSRPEPYVCSTTTPTPVETETPPPTVKGQGLETYAIILIVLACVGAAGGTGFAVYWFGFRTSDQESVKRSNNDNTDGNGVNSKLQSEPDRVEYAAVNKPESDPQPAPRSSKPPGNNTEPEKMELQYADIDHSNRGRSNEIHQPADAPTEYATVQSVIV